MSKPKKIEEVLKKTAKNIPNGKFADSPIPIKSVGDPDCPHCKGLGYLGMDHPVGHPNFGEVEICSCRAEEISELNQNRLYALSNLKELRELTFENFNPRGRVGLRPVQAESLELAHTHAKQFAGNMNGWLVLQGIYGSGKTHLAAAIS
ncbi:MAG: hypothetical protein HOH75_10230, partial [Chloroflexi bacterium]|nr:hypothetical protein [Chloroflexota bacterium]